METPIINLADNKSWGL